MARLALPAWWHTFGQAMRQWGAPILTIVIFIVLFIFSILHLLKQSRTFSDQLIVDEVQRLSTIFQKIDGECKIIGFRHQKNYIDFLTIERFAGTTSEVGAMDLMLPKNWHGPYVQENPVVQEKLYQIVRTKKGYFIAPGDGVKLSSGKTVGVDIVLDESADIKGLVNDPKGLQFQGKPLALPLSISGVGKRNIFDFMAEPD